MNALGGQIAENTLISEITVGTRRKSDTFLLPISNQKGAYWFRLTTRSPDGMPWKSGWPRKIRRTNNINANYDEELALAA
jgi:hypothetical protein